MKSNRKDGAGILGLGAVACAACCAGPIIAFLGGIAALGAVGTLLFGAIAFAIAASFIALVLVWRRHQGTRCQVAATPNVAVDPPVRRTVTRR